MAKVEKTNEKDIKKKSVKSKKPVDKKEEKKEAKVKNIEKAKVETKEEEKEGKKKYLLLLLLLLFLFVFVIGVTYGKDIYNVVSEQIVEVLNLRKPTAPIITGGDETWAKERLIYVEKDSEAKDGLAYYEYCIRDKKSTKDCTWNKTTTKNIKVTTSGIYYVTFRAVDTKERRGYNSNTEVAYIDNNNPQIEKVNVKEITANSINIEVEAKDKESGIKEYLYSLDGQNYEKGKLNYTYSNLEKDKEYTIYIKVVDKVGNETTISMNVKTKSGDNETCDLNCDTDGDGTCDLNCDTNGDGKCDLNCDTDGDGKCDLNCDTNGDGKCDTNCDTDTENPETTPTPTPSQKPEPDDGDDEKEEEEEEKEIPIINLDKVPTEFTYGEKYDLPSYVSFGSKKGTYECIVEGKEYKDTSTLTIGKHLIVCTATSEDNIRVMVEKEVNVIVGEGEEEVWDGWIRLNLTYPENSTNWEWRLGNEGEIRDGYDYTGWQAYTGPILVKLEDADDIYIRYDINGETYVVAPSGKVAVDIQPNKFTLKSDETTKVTIYYDKDAVTKEYRIDDGKWQEYKGTFTVGVNQVVEARATKQEKVYDSEGNYLYTSKRTGTDSVFISEYIETGTSVGGGTTPGGVTYVPGTGPGGTTITTPTPESKPSTYLAGPAITASPSSELVSSVKVKVTPEEEAEKIYISIGNGKYQEYTKEVEVKENTTIKAYYVRYSDGKVSETSYYYVQNIKEDSLPYVRIDASPNNYIEETQESVEVEISGSNYDTLEYSLDGVIYETYTSSFTLTSSSTVYAKGTNNQGVKIEKLTIPTTQAPTEKEELTVHIELNPDKSGVKGIVNKTEVEITFDEKAEKKYYKLSYYGEYKEYTGPFEVEENTTVYAYCTSENGSGKAHKTISFLTTGISSPIITGSPETATQQVKIEITYDENATVERYQIGSGPMLEYNGPFYVYENTTIKAYNKNVLGYENESEYIVENIVDLPKYTVIEKDKYFIIKLNYPSESTQEAREYKWKEDGEWKVYDQKGILLIKPEYKEEFDNIEDGIKVEDENGKEVVFTDHYYYIDVPFSELMENIFMRWDKSTVKAPQIVINPSNEPTKEVEVGIVYSNSLVKKYYKIVKEDGTDSGWKEYTGSFKVNENNVIVYAKGITINNNDSEISSKKITNIDKEAPVITVKGDFETPKQQVTVKVTAEDNMMMYMVMWASGEQNKDYFKENGTSMKNGGTFKVEENGKYTIYAVDQVGNETVKVIEITNIDKNAPDIIIDVLTEKYGTEAEVSIDYGDSKTKEYRIGETSTTYQTYTENIIIKSYDVLDLVNEDGSLTIYARGTDEAGNITEVKEIIYVLDLDAPVAPIIHSTAGYPVLTEYGVVLGQDNYIIFDETRDDIDNYYSLDEGETWEIYTGPFEVTTGTIMAKSVKRESGLTITSTKTIDMPSDAIGLKGYDGKENTATGDLKVASIMYIDESMYGKQVYIYGRLTKGIEIVLEDGTSVSVEAFGSNSGPSSKIVDIPENAVKFVFPAYTHMREASDLYEIRPYSNPIINIEKVYPNITNYGMVYPYNLVKIDYWQTSVQRLYSLDEGQTWQEYQDKAIRLEIGDTIQAKGIDKDGNETIASNYTSIIYSDVPGLNGYDGKENTQTGDFTTSKIITIDKTMQGQPVYIYGRLTKGIEIILDDGTSVSVEAFGSNSGPSSKIVDIPENAVKFVFPAFTNMSAASDLYEIRPYSTPIIDVENIYPNLTQYKVENPHNIVTIKYFSTSVKKLYSLDEGATWQIYQDKSIRLEIGDTIQAKGIDKNGNETLISNYESSLLSDMPGLNGYDGKEETNTGDFSTSKIITIDKAMQGKQAYIYGRLVKGVEIVLEDGTSTNTGAIGGNASPSSKTVDIPENAVKFVFPAFTNMSAASDLYEISPSNIPIIKANLSYSILTENGVEKGINEITIEYFNTSVQKLYSLDEGATWQEYEDKIIGIKAGDIIQAKGIDKDGKETPIASYTGKLPEDAMGLNAYDGNMSTRTNQYGKLYIDKSMYNKTAKLYSNYNCSGGGCKATNTVYFVLSDNTEVKQTITFYGSWSAVEGCEVTIPENAIYMEMKSTNTIYNLYEIKVSTTPVIKQTNTYPNLSVSEFKDSSISVNINYLSYLTQKLYSIDNGTTWQEYTKSFKANVGDVIQAKAIDEDGNETEVSTYTVISDSLSSEALDNNKETTVSITKNTNQIFTISEDAIGKDIRFFFSGTIAQDATIKVYDKQDTELESISIIDLVTVFEIPENAYKLVINAGSSALTLSEINLRNTELSSEITNPVIELNDLNWTTSKTIDITYPEGNYTNEYSLDLGETWQAYLSPITVDKETTILARTVENGKVVSSSSFTVTKVDSVEPTVELDTPSKIIVGSSYNLPTNYTVGTSGGNASCLINGNEVTNTNTLEIGNYEIVCTVSNNIGITKTITKNINVLDDIVYEGESILSILENEDLESGKYNFSVNGERYPVHVYNYDESQDWTETKTFGDDEDVATASENAKNMVVVKVNGDLKIASGVQVTAYGTEYGGPKGLTLYVTGTLTNNGEITMSSKGAKAEGQDVYLWKNTDGSYEFVPSEGATGGTGVSGSQTPGIAGNNGSYRQTGGGGSGGSHGGCGYISGAGGTGTSYSGGTGGGAVYSCMTGQTDGSSIGGAGGNATNNVNSGSGAGNPTGSNGTSGNNGTGGLLNIYANNYMNNGTVSSNGTTGGIAYVGGGSSGGGSVNVFYTNTLIEGIVTVDGGSAIGNKAIGGAGGLGTITYKQIN